MEHWVKHIGHCLFYRCYCLNRVIDYEHHCDHRTLFGAFAGFLKPLQVSQKHNEKKDALLALKEGGDCLLTTFDSIKTEAF